MGGAANKAIMRNFPQRDLEEATVMYMRGVLINKVIYDYPIISRRTITDRAKRKYILRIKSRTPDGPHRGGGGGYTMLIVGMKKLGFPVTRGVVLIKENGIYLEAFGTKTRIIQGLGCRWLQRFTEIYPLFSYYKRVVSKTSVNYI